MIEQILETPGKKKETWPQAIATDNCGQDSNDLIDLVEDIYGPYHWFVVLQVIYILFIDLTGFSTYFMQSRGCSKQ